MVPIEEISKIQSHKDLSVFIRKLRQDYVDNPNSWENSDLPAFLEAMAAWVYDITGYYQNTDQSMPNVETWRTVATILYASKIYE